MRMCEVLDIVETLDSSPVQQNIIALATGKNKARHQFDFEEIGQILNENPQVISRLLGRVATTLDEQGRHEDIRTISQHLRTGLCTRLE